MSLGSDIEQKAKMFITARRLEGLSKYTLEGYELELRSLAKHIQKPVAEITPSDLREYLSHYEYLKPGSLARKVSVLRTFFAWLVDEEIIPHVLRHTMATLTLNNGADIVAVQALLGHTNPATTQVYARITDQRKREQHRKYLVQ